MSNTEEENTASGENDGGLEKFTAHPSSGMLVNRRLKSFGAPDLEVVVGKSQRLYRYHSFILASYSSYVDTMLSSQMWKESQEKHICFPDIEPEVWEKMIKILEPAGLKAVTVEHKDFLDLLPICDKYQFEDGMRFCNEFLEKHYVHMIEDYQFLTNLEVYVPLSVMVYGLDLPCKPKAIEYASILLSNWLTSLEEDHIGQLLPLVENDEKVLRAAVTTVVGRRSNNMSVEEIRAVTKEGDFPKRCLARSKQVEELEEILKHVSVDDYGVRVSVYGDWPRALCGKYVGCDRIDDGLTYGPRPKAPGAQQKVYRIEKKQLAKEPRS